MPPSPTTPPKKQDRADTPYASTRSVCPVCKELVEARVVTRGGRVILRSHCPTHGWTEALVSEDAEGYHAQRRFNKPGTVPLHFEREFHGCPNSCGLCTEHQQHTCLGIIDIIQECNLRCPVCFADAKGGDSGALSLDRIGAMMDRLVRAEGDPEVIQLSGGEPTLHPQLPQVLALAREKGLGKILLNTNGVLIDEDPALLDSIKPYDPTIYLQFDGFDADTYRSLRGKDLSAQKLRVVEKIGDAGLRIVLVATIVRGVNEHELGALVDFALDSDWIRCLNLQPATFAGRYAMTPGGASDDPTDRVTLPELSRRISEQSRYGLKRDDFFPIPCPDPACSICTYIHKVDGEARPLPRLVDVEDYLDYLKNTSVAQMTDQLRSSLESLFSMSAVPGEDTTKSFCEACGINLDWGEIEREITMVSAMHFMDEHTFDVHRLQKCCVHQILPDDGGIIPFCAYNVLHRGK